LCYDERWIGIAGSCNTASVGSAPLDQGHGRRYDWDFCISRFAAITGGVETATIASG
jgi:hypothetical protein